MKIAINNQVLFQMYEYAAYAKLHHKSEIAGWAHYTKERGIYKLAPLTKQEVTGGAEVDNFPNELLSRVDYPMQDMIVQWHSHVDMRVFFSGTDVANIKDSLKLLPLLISIVVNCKGQYACRVDVRNIQGIEFISPTTLTDVELIPYFKNRKVSNEVKTKVSHKKYVAVQQTPTNPTNNFGYWDAQKGHYYYYHSSLGWGYWDKDAQKFVPRDSSTPASNNSGQKYVPPSQSQPQSQPQQSPQKDLFEDYTPAVSKADEKIVYVWDEKDLLIAKYRMKRFADSNPNYTWYNEEKDITSLVFTLTGDCLEVDIESAETDTEIGGLEVVSRFINVCEEYIKQHGVPA